MGSLAFVIHPSLVGRLPLAGGLYLCRGLHLLNPRAARESCTLLHSCTCRTNWNSGESLALVGSLAIMCRLARWTADEILALAFCPTLLSSLVLLFSIALEVHLRGDLLWRLVYTGGRIAIVQRLALEGRIAIEGSVAPVQRTTVVFNLAFMQRIAILGKHVVMGRMEIVGTFAIVGCLAKAFSFALLVGITSKRSLAILFSLPVEGMTIVRRLPLGGEGCNCAEACIHHESSTANRCLAFVFGLALAGSFAIIWSLPVVGRIAIVGRLALVGNLAVVWWLAITFSIVFVGRLAIVRSAELVRTLAF